ncbi:hypothetical protein IV203_008358 [Nitzschia inconspicua]|uniref:Endonuclease/exonuclease/phosphatase domain-containing protein n=1 Tax=Nitzschia inconspicua TaxID=303405 RepID=A0A9K3KYC8_9STRA|nr:hypothetical protein IV203_008358 [Nitzschia inconspicua]
MPSLRQRLLPLDRLLYPLLLLCDPSKMMIVRVRSNLGLWRVKLHNDDIANVEDVQNELKTLHPQLEHYQYAKPFSFDVAMTIPLDTKAPLKMQGIDHGAIIYCRWEETAASSTETRQQSQPDEAERTDISTGKDFVQNKMTRNVPPKPPTQQQSSCNRNPMMPSSKIRGETHVQKQEIVELLASSSDDDDEDSVVLISPPRKSNAVFKKSASKSSSDQQLPRKRQRSTSPTRASTTDVTSRKKSPSSSTGTSRLFVTNDSPTNFQIASYNVWFGPPDPDVGQLYPKERMTAIVECIQNACMTQSTDNPLLFIGFQELTPSLVDYLKPLLGQIGYKLCTQPLGFGGSSYGVGVAVPQDLDIVKHEFIPYSNTQQGRGLLYIKTPTFLLGTTHLESYTGQQSDGSKEREKQIVDAALFCKTQLEVSSSLKLAVIVGDLNWDDERKQKRSEATNKNLLSLLPGGWKDAGEPFDYTYDAKENPMLGGNLRRRFDRCIYYSNSLECLELRKIGQEAIPGLVWQKKNPYTGKSKPMAVTPSDHFGLVLTFGKAS